MASNALIYLAGVGTVVTALGVGFGGAMVLTSNNPTQKLPPAAFARHEQSIGVEKAQPDVARQTTTYTAQTPVVSTRVDTMRSDVPTAKGVIDSLAYAPPQPSDAQRPSVQVPSQTAPDPLPKVVAKTPASESAEPRSAKTERSAAKPSETKKPARREAAKPKHEKKKIDPARVGPQIQFAERRQRELDDEDEPRMSFASERDRRSGRSEGFFSFMFGQ